MGTRNLTMVILNKEVKIAQYGQWDGYPGGQGATALNALRSFDLNKFREAVSKTRFLSIDEIEAKFDALGVVDNDGWISLADANKIKNAYPELNRDMGAAVLAAVYNGSATELKDDSSFAGDSLFCEWGYVIDLDNNTFEVYEGFNTEPLSESDRFVALKADRSEYYPIKLSKSFSLDALPTEEEFTEAFSAEVEEE